MPLVARYRTPIDDNTLPELLRGAHFGALGIAPSRARLGMAWTHVCHETWKLASSWNNNLGNFTCFPNEGLDYFDLSTTEYAEGDGKGAVDMRLHYVAYDSIEEGARAYWQRMSTFYKSAFALFDSGDGGAVARELGKPPRRYYTGRVDVYARSLTLLYAEFVRRFGSWYLAGVADAGVTEPIARLEAALAMARQWPGLGWLARDPFMYAALVFPYDTLERRPVLAASLSSCALLGHAYYRLLGLADARLARPYDGHSDAVTVVLEAARAEGAWRTPSRDVKPPGVGDALLMGRNGDKTWGEPAFEHVAIVVDAEPETGALVCVEGGQGIAGTSIGRGRYALVWRDEALWAVKADMPYTAGGAPSGRRLQGWADGMAMVGA
jgi:hypothetical protein